MTFGEKVLQFYGGISLDAVIPDDIGVMHPFTEPEAWAATEAFYKKFFDDNGKRVFIIGINPGRFGGGVTGIPFTDPIRLERDCGITNPFAKKQELSSVFIYDMINAFGGPEAFYNKFYITAVSPLGFVKNGKNLNYYDDKVLFSAIKDFIVNCLREQIAFGASETALCLGEGENYKQLMKLNKEFGFFKEIIPLAHPRFIMQYRLKKKEEYVREYLRVMGVVTQ